MSDTAIGGAASSGIGWGIKGLVGGFILGALIAGGAAGVIAYLGTSALITAAAPAAGTWLATNAVGVAATTAALIGSVSAFLGGKMAAVTLGTYSALFGALKGGLTAKRSDSMQPEMVNLIQQNAMMAGMLQERQRAAMCGDNPARTDNAAKVEAQRTLACQQEAQRA